jgi:aerobic carbon-monoxide dehydrogenase medium subunit
MRRLRQGTLSPFHRLRNANVKAPAFAYAKPRSLVEAFDLLEGHGDEARVIAGGQSLVPMLNLRLASPRVLVDITGLPGMTGISVLDGSVRIGSLTRHREIERSADIARHCPLLSQAAPHIAHVAIRNSGTLGGSIALADPAAEWPACCLALDASFRLVSRDGERTVPAREFFKALYATALKPGELVAGVEIPLLPRHRSVFLELSRRRGDYAIVGVAAIAKTDAGRLHDVRLAYLGGAEVPRLASHAMRAAEGKPPPADLAAELARDLSPMPDLEHKAATKLHLANVLARRALAALAA